MFLFSFFVAVTFYLGYIFRDQEALLQKRLRHPTSLLMVRISVILAIVLIAGVVQLMFES